MNEKSGRRLLSFVFTLAMVVGLLSGMSLTALAANESVASVTSGGTTSYYSSFSEAVSALGSAAEGATLKLLEDSSTVSKLSFTGSKTFDLNGKTLTSTASDSAILLNADNAVLTVTDSSDSKNGKISFRSSANSNKL